jgi:hypothetical protein
MTASHIFYDGKVIDVSTNYEEKVKNGKEIDYDVNEIGFKKMIELVALGTTAQFAYNPTKEEIKTYYAKKNKISAKSLENKDLDPKDEEEIRNILIDVEAKRPI